MTPKRNLGIAEAKAEYAADLERAIRSAWQHGLRDLPDVVPWAWGADPRVVDRVARRMTAGGSSPASLDESDIADARARKASSEFLLKLPAADPMSSQWWFGLDTIEDLGRQLSRAAGDSKTVFLGCPTVAHYFGVRFGQMQCFDHDEDVVRTLNREINRSASLWDARDGTPAITAPGVFAAVLMDPPWYSNLTRAFLAAALRAIHEGILFCTLPSLLTRPGIIEERNTLLRELLEIGLKVEGIDTGAVGYVVPGFEAAAFKDINGFSGKPWRRGDLLKLRVPRKRSPLNVGGLGDQPQTTRFSREPSRFRIFLARDRSNPLLRSWAQRARDFESNVSTRTFDSSNIGVWTSAKTGACVRDARAAETLLEAWAKGRTSTDAAGDLVDIGLDRRAAEKCVSEFQKLFSLWNEKSIGRRLTPAEIEESAKKSRLSAAPSGKQFQSTSDGFRASFQRDRDRVLWSSGLKHLANKTQVFSFGDDDNVRQRLAHSIEVMQLASTIGASFGLDLGLIDAGALAHDIGHTPFGHAGEHALNSMVHRIAPAAGGFNHYEHGVDVVRWLEDVYRSPSSDGHPGLNLTPEVAECIFKHTYARRGIAQSQSALYAKSKHRDLFRDDACHLEGQAVRIADKISYLVSDLEDGIRLGVLGYKDLARCRFFSRSPIDIKPSPGETLLERFLAQRRVVLRVLMEDVILETERRLLGISSRAGLRKVTDYVVEHSRELKTDTSEIWRTLQKQILHEHPIVKTANLRAARTISELFLLFAGVPGLVDRAFVRSHEWLWEKEYMRVYISRCGSEVSIPKSLTASMHLERMIGITVPSGPTWRVPIQNVVLAKDYVASLTDSRACSLHQNLLGRVH